jgi:phosphatidylglycerophosphate synthase
VPTVKTGPLIGLSGQVALLAALAGTVGLGRAGWLAGLAYGLFLCVLLVRGMRRVGRPAFGPADRVTMTRATLAGGVTALAADSITRPAHIAAMVALGAVALLLDGVDGKVARRTGTASAFGARFDMEVDAFLILVLSAYAVRTAGVWVLAMGAMRYAFVAAAWGLPWMRGALPARPWRKVVAATQGIVLVIAAGGVLPRAAALVALAAALAMLVQSFGRDVAWLRAHRAPTAVPALVEAGAVAVPAPAGAVAVPAPAGTVAVPAPAGTVAVPAPAGTVAVPALGRGRVAVRARRPRTAGAAAGSPAGRTGSERAAGSGRAAAGVGGAQAGKSVARPGRPAVLVALAVGRRLGGSALGGPALGGPAVAAHDRGAFVRTGA